MPPFLTIEGGGSIPPGVGVNLVKGRVHSRCIVGNLESISLGYMGRGPSGLSAMRGWGGSDL